MAALLVASSAWGQTSPAAARTVEIRSGDLRLKAFLWTPTGKGHFPAVLFNHGSGGPDAAHTAGVAITEAAERLAPVFVNRGYAFLYLFRRGHGPSTDQAPFIQDLLNREEAAHGSEARQHLNFVLATTQHLEDVLAAIHFLKGLPRVDRRRIAVAGHSFGGQLTILAAARDNSVRAAVGFGAAAVSWNRSAELRERLLTAVRRTSAAIMLVQAENDYSTAPSRALSAELQRLGKPHLLKIYPALGESSDQGHNLVYLAIPQWKNEVLAFLDRHLGR